MRSTRRYQSPASGRADDLAEVKSSTGAHDRPLVDGATDPAATATAITPNANENAISIGDDAPTAIRAGSTTGDVSGTKASTDATPCPGRSARPVRADQDEDERRHCRSGLLLALDERTERAREREVQRDAEHEPRRPAATAPAMPAGRSPPAPNLVSDRHDAGGQRVQRPVTPTPITLPNRSGAGRTMASSTSLMRLAFSMAVPLATWIVSVSRSM